jgi:signal transduction histidine kinase
MKSILERLGRPDAISWVSGVVIVSLLIPATYVSSLVAISGREVAFFAIVAVRLLILVGIFALGRLALERFAMVNPQPLITIATFVMAIVVSTAAFDTLLVLTEFAPDYYLERRLRTTLVGSLLVLITSSLIVSYAREFSRSNTELESVVRDLDTARSDAVDRFERRKAELIAQIRDSVDGELGRLRTDGAGLEPAVMETLIDDVIRPISYSLNRDFSAEAPTPYVPEKTRTQWSRVVEFAFRGKPFRWKEFSVMMAIISAPFLTINFGLRGALGAALVVGVCAVFMLVFGALWRFIPSGVTSGTRAMIFTAAHIPMGIAAGWSVSVVSGFSSLAPGRMAAFIAICLLASFTVTLVSSSLLLQRETNASLRDAVDELKRELITANASYRQLNKGVSRVLHGPVQEAVTAAMLKLRKGQGLGDPVTAAREIRASINAALELLQAPDVAPVDLDTTFRDLQALWDGVVGIDCVVSGDKSLIEADQRAAFAVSELVREACSNAIRHGKAPRIDISVEVRQDDRVVEIRIDNDGLPLASDATPGLGSQLFDEQSMEWAREQVGDRVRVTARLPLAPRSP